ncbi:MAG: hypothetical protein AAF652_02550 [Cyanobacteria bacterium P01_C01_bin.72]
MQLRTSNENLSSSYALLAIPLVALVTFVVGYTASRATLSQTAEQQVVSEDYNLVIPHQATLWKDFGN